MKDGSMVAAVIGRLMLMLLVPVGGTAFGHPQDEWAAQFETLARWAQAVERGDRETEATLTISGGQAFTVDPSGSLITEFAIFSAQEGDVVVAEPVMMTLDGGTFLSAFQVTLVNQDGKWLIGGLQPSAARPPAFDPPLLPEHADTRTVTFHLTDSASGQPAHARVRITDAAGEYWPPDGHQKRIRTGWRQDVGGDVLVDGRTWAYVGQHFNARLPEGEYRIEVRKGTEYLPAAADFRVGSADSPEPVAVAVERWIDMAAEGWHAGDTHTHFLDEGSALAELRAEDLSVIYVLATKWGELITDVNRFTGRPSPHGSDGEIVVYNEETRHRWLGHTILHGIERLVYPLTWGGPTEGVPGGYDYPAMAHQADRAHDQGGLVTWAHFPSPGGELAVDVGLGKIDTVDLFTWGDAFNGPRLPSGESLPSAVDTWYKFLNTDARLPATAGTDKMLNVQIAGSVKTYAYTGEAFSYQRWLDALKSGRTLVSTGPVVTMTVDGEPIGSSLEVSPGGSVQVQAKLTAPYGQYPVDVLEIVAGGRVIASIGNEDQASELSLDATVNVSESTWVAARARGSRQMPLQVWSVLRTTGIPPMAHTSPVYLIVDGAPIWREEDARVLAASVKAAVDWASSEGRYQTDQQRAEILALYQRAWEHYTGGPPVSGR